MKVYQALASAIAARENCKITGNTLWFDQHLHTVNHIAREYLPSGSGFDSGTSVMIDDCKPDKLVLQTSYHHMNEVGMYDGWTSHSITVRPAFSGINIVIHGRDRNGFKEYAYQVFEQALNNEYVPEPVVDHTPHAAKVGCTADKSVPG